jgi:hypothetical protein
MELEPENKADEDKKNTDLCLGLSSNSKLKLYGSIIRTELFCCIKKMG